jgi:glucose dehydrogenase
LSQPLARIDRDDWEAYGNDQGGTRFSPLSQINTSNVVRLTKVWEADMAPTAPGPINGLQITPIMIGDTLYACDGHNGIHAFDAETGRERWRRDISKGTPPSGKPCRGVAYYKVPNASGPCAERIFAPTRRWSLLMQEPGRSVLVSAMTARWTCEKGSLPIRMDCFTSVRPHRLSAERWSLVEASPTVSTGAVLRESSGLMMR